MSRDLNKEMTRLNFEFKKQFSAITEDHERWRECVGNTGYLIFAVGYMYVKKHFDDQSKSKVRYFTQKHRFDINAPEFHAGRGDGRKHSQGVPKRALRNNVDGRRYQRSGLGKSGLYQTFYRLSRLVHQRFCS